MLHAMEKEKWCVKGKRVALDGMQNDTDVTAILQLNKTSRNILK
jgi:hypothetical protein